MTLIPLVNIGSSCYFGGDAMTCLLNQLTSAAGGPALFGLILGGALFVVFYIASEGSLATPTVALILTGAVTIPMLPAFYGRIAYGVVLIGLAAAIWQVVQKYVLTRAVR